MRYNIPQYRVKLVREDRAKCDLIRINTPYDAEKFLSHLKEESQEVFAVVFLNARGEVTGYQEISRGIVNESLVHPREVFKGAILHNSCSIICAHNHPTGNSEPSIDDIKVTTKLVDAGKLLGIPVLDHLVIGDDTSSIRELHPELWSKES